MNTPSETPALLWTARTFSALVILFLLFDGITKIVGERHVVEAFMRLGVPVDLAPGIGILVVICALVYAVPRTAILGALLITALLGGAVATHVRANSPPFEAYIFPAMMGALTWVPLWLRELRLRALVPLRS